jgi:hypothetical protein
MLRETNQYYTHPLRMNSANAILRVGTLPKTTVSFHRQLLQENSNESYRDSAHTRHIPNRRVRGLLRRRVAGWRRSIRGTSSAARCTRTADSRYGCGEIGHGDARTTTDTFNGRSDACIDISYLPSGLGREKNSSLMKKEEKPLGFWFRRTCNLIS